MELHGDVAVVGGGASGALAVAELARSSPGPLTILWLDRTGNFSRGVAYSTREPRHVLNVPAGKMGADPDDPSGFFRWARARGLELTPEDFLSRSLYGDYLEEFVRQRERAHPNVRLLRVRGEAVEATSSPSGLRLTLRSRDAVSAKAVVLATGNLLPAALPGTAAASDSVRVGWEPRALEGLAPEDEVLLVGTGLTAVDALISLEQRGHRGTIYALSPHGLFPRVHAPAGRALYAEAPVGPVRVRPLLRELRARVRAAESKGSAWRDVIDALRPVTIQHWTALREVERRRFLRHARTFWEVHRHRVAPEAWRSVDALRSRGQLQPLVARLIAIEPGSKGRVRILYRPRGERETRSLEVARVLNCSGPRPVGSAGDDPLLSSLLRRGMAVLDPHGLGFRTDGGAIVDRSGVASSRLFALGPLRRGELWETTAIPEIRVQARETARRVLGEIAEAPNVARP